MVGWRSCSRGCHENCRVVRLRHSSRPTLSTSDSAPFIMTGERASPPMNHATVGRCVRREQRAPCQPQMTFSRAGALATRDEHSDRRSLAAESDNPAASATPASATLVVGRHTQVCCRRERTTLARLARVLRGVLCVSPGSVFCSWAMRRCRPWVLLLGPRVPQNGSRARLDTARALGTKTRWVPSGGVQPAHPLSMAAHGPRRVDMGV